MYIYTYVFIGVLIIQDIGGGGHGQSATKNMCCGLCSVRFGVVFYSNSNNQPPMLCRVWI